VVDASVLAARAHVASGAMHAKPGRLDSSKLRTTWLHASSGGQRALFASTAACHLTFTEDAR
jgi:hypothetical protein